MKTRFIALAAIPAAVFALAACSSSATSSGGKSNSTTSSGAPASHAATKKNLTFAVMDYGQKFPFTASIYKGMQQAAKAAGVKLTNFDAGGAVATQLNQV